MKLKQVREGKWMSRSEFSETGSDEMTTLPLVVCYGLMAVYDFTRNLENHFSKCNLILYEDNKVNNR